jgi:hypothetical protein
MDQFFVLEVTMGHVWLFCATRKATFNLGKMMRYCAKIGCPHLKQRRRRGRKVRLQTMPGQVLLRILDSLP